jgi:hypothetical protein
MDGFRRKSAIFGLKTVVLGGKSGFARGLLARERKTKMFGLFSNMLASFSNTFFFAWNTFLRFQKMFGRFSNINDFSSPGCYPKPRRGGLFIGSRKITISLFVFQRRGAAVDWMRRSESRPKLAAMPPVQSCAAEKQKELLGGSQL